MVDIRRSRRAYLATLGSLGASSLAGCSSIQTIVDTQVQKFDDRVQWSANVAKANDLHLAEGTLYVYTDNAIYALNAQSGDQKWNTSLPKDDSDRVGYYAPFTVTEDRIYFSGHEGVFAYSTDDGSQVWQRDDLDLFRRALVVDGSLYCQTGNTLNVIDPESGSQEREYEFDENNIEAYGPAYRPADGRFYYVVKDDFGPNVVRAVDPTTGEIEWDLSVPFSRTQTRPVIGNDFLYAVSARNNVDQIDQNELVAVDPDQQEIAWQVQTRAALKPPVVGENRVFVASHGTDKGFLTAIDPQDRTAVWSHLVVDGQGYLSRPLVGESRVTVAIEEQQIHTRTIDDGTEVSSFQLPTAHDIQPVQDGERLYVAGGTNVWGLDR